MRQAQTFLSTVPIAAFRAGDFSALLPRTIVYDPRTNPRTPLPGNIMPPNVINPTSARMIELYPEPNLPGEINNFLYNPVQTNQVDQTNTRIDYRTGNSSIFGRYSWEDADTYNPGNLPEPAIGAGPGRPGRVVIPSHQAVIGYGRALSPSKYYEFRVGYSRMFQGIYDLGPKYGNIAEATRDSERERRWRGARFDNDEHHRDDRARRRRRKLAEGQQQLGDRSGVQLGAATGTN